MNKSTRKQQNKADLFDDNIDPFLNSNNNTLALTQATNILKPSILNKNHNISLILDQNPLSKNRNCHAVTDWINTILPLNDL